MKKERKLLFSLTKKDFEIQTFRAGGKGGQKQNKTNSGVRIIHRDSGAVGESREERSQIQNKNKAFERLIQTKDFILWHNIKCGYALQGIEDHKRAMEQEVEECVNPKNLKIEYYEPVNFN